MTGINYSHSLVKVRTGYLVDKVEAKTCVQCWELEVIPLTYCVDFFVVFAIIMRLPANDYEQLSIFL